MTFPLAMMPGQTQRTLCGATSEARTNTTRGWGRRRRLWSLRLLATLLLRAFLPLCERDARLWRTLQRRWEPNWLLVGYLGRTLVASGAVSTMIIKAYRAIGLLPRHLLVTSPYIGNATI